MSSRLDRLLILLDTGSNHNVRVTAAKQIAQLAVKSVRSDVPGDEWDVKHQVSSSTKDAGEYAELMAVVGRVLPYLHSKSFDTRTAASTALTHICTLLPVWAPITSHSSPPQSNVDTSLPPSFPPFSVTNLLNSPPSSLLLASSGKEFARPASFRSPAEVARARKEAMGRLGLDFLGMGDDPDAEMDWDKELADGGDGETSSAADTKVESLDVDMREAEAEANPSDATVKDTVLPPLNTALRTQDVKMEDSPSASPNGHVSAISTVPFTPLQPFSVTSTIPVAPSSVSPPIPLTSQEPPVELSARERNRLKRKRKAGTSAFVAGTTAPSGSSSNQTNGANGPPGPPPPAKGTMGKYNTVAAGEAGSSKVRLTAPKGGQASRLSLPGELSPTGTGPAPEKVVVDPSRGGQVDAHEPRDGSKVLSVREGEWVWEGVRNVLEVDLFSPNWEIRHGAAMGLCEIIKLQGANGGMRSGLSQDQNDHMHEKWCNDLAAKFLCVFVLDRFGDFVSDQVVAPVRETVSQTLASLLLHMPRRSILHVHDILLQMIKQDSPEQHRNGTGKGRSHVWEVRHAGLLGIKYEVAVRSDLVDKAQAEDGKHILRGVVEAAVLGLGDHDDDVRAVAASCLLPVASYIVQQLPDELGRVLDVLWNCLADMKDDLSSSVGAVMDLLGKLVSFDEVIQLLGNPSSSRPLNTLAPTLFSFFRHTITNVRLAVVKTLHSFLQVPSLPREWITAPLLRLLLQNLVVEEKADIRDVSLETWRTAVRILSTLTTDQGALWLESIVPELVLEWHEIVMTPLGTPIDTTKLFSPSADGYSSSERHNIDKSILNQDLSLVSSELILKGRVAAAKALAFMIAVWPIERQDAMFGGLLRHYVVSASMLQRLLTATIVEEWAREADVSQPDATLVSFCPFAENLGQTMLAFLDGQTPEFYHEMAYILTRLLQDCTALLTGFATECKVPPSKIPVLGTTIDITGKGDDPEAFTIEKAHMAVDEYFYKLKTSLGRTKKKELAVLEDRRKTTIAAIVQYETTKNQHDTRVSAAFAAAVVALRIQMPRLTPIIKSLTAGVRSEDNIDLQKRSAAAVASIVELCSRTGAIPPLTKIVKNLCAFLCQDTEQTPTFARHPLDGILSFKRETPSSSHYRSTKDKEIATPSEEVAKARLTRRGAHLAFVELSTKFGPSLFDILPAMWDCICGSLLGTYRTDDPNDADDEMENQPQKGQDVIDNLVILDAVAPTFHERLWSRFFDLYPRLVLALRSRYAVVRQLAAQSFATICDVATSEAMRYVIDHVLPLLGDALVITNRQGAIELIYHIVRKLDLKALPYVIFMVVPVLGRMSDPNDDIRAIATNTFASLVKMVPLEAGLPDPPGFSEELLQKRVSEREFLMQLLDGSKVEHYKVPVLIKVEPRKYQQEGINWLAFLAKYHLHGILCDDMGLGKTLQSICILASKHHERAEKFKATKSPDSVHLPSIVICPPTLTGHWYHEIIKYTDNLKPMTYVGSTKDRNKLLSTIHQFDVIITSYEVVRNDVVNLANLNWHYCILDEGHIIKNAKTKLTKAVKTIRAHHRLILSGTPIQNNVLELWSLFDFLMPGFLGTEASFHERFGKPILSTRDGKASAKNSEAAALALEALHKQVLPFLLRRLKEDVLNDLPPKIIQDYYCELSDVQRQLYDEFANSQAQNVIQDAVKSEKAPGGQQHVFQSLQYLRKLCNHPALVLKNDQVAIDALLQKTQWKGEKSGTLHDIQHAPKLQALRFAKYTSYVLDETNKKSDRQLLLDCGIGGSAGAESMKGEPDDADLTGGSGNGPFSQHRVLVFCQLKQMLDIIETDLFKKHMPSVTYMRLDGGTDPSKRHAIVQTFNADPSIDVLLLTTHVGGLGLTLTGADTVIFIEHDWNPMKDLQAMDRAHRLGQKKVVNVYRLVTKGTLEEKIMGLQRFKLNIANSVITQQNSGLASMDTDLVLDLFRRTTEAQDAAAAKRKETANNGTVSQKNILEGLEDLPAEEEYGGLELSSFMDSIGR